MSSTKATAEAGKSIVGGVGPGASRSSTKSVINFPTQNEIESFQNQRKCTSRPNLFVTSNGGENRPAQQGVYRSEVLLISR